MGAREKEAGMDEGEQRPRTPTLEIYAPGDGRPAQPFINGVPVYTPPGEPWTLTWDEGGTVRLSGTFVFLDAAARPSTPEQPRGRPMSDLLNPADRVQPGES
jgi:hypothetical protein